MQELPPTNKRSNRWGHERDGIDYYKEKATPQDMEFINRCREILARRGILTNFSEHIEAGDPVPYYSVCGIICEGIVAARSLIVQMVSRTSTIKHHTGNTI